MRENDQTEDVPEDGAGRPDDDAIPAERPDDDAIPKRGTDRTEHFDGTATGDTEGVTGGNVPRRGFLAGIAATSVLPAAGRAAAGGSDWRRESGADGSDLTATVTQGDTSFEVEPLSMDQTVRAFYGYADASSHTPTDLETPNASLLFLYQGSEGLSLVVIHGSPEGSKDGAVTFGFSGLPDSGFWAVRDDDRDFDVGSTTEPDWWWDSKNNDGGAYFGLGEEFSITIDPAFNEAADRYTGSDAITDWQVLSGDATSPERTSLALDEPVTIETGSAGPVSVTASPSTARPGEVVDFTTETTVDGEIRSYEWDFGDGSIGIGSTTTHVYDDPGEYRVEVTVTTNTGSEFTGSTTVQVAEGGLSVEVSPETPSVGESVEFAVGGDTSGFSGFEWEFGDGQTGSGETVTHTYGSPGEYTAAVLATDASGTKRFGTATVSVTASEVSIEVGDDDPVVGEPIDFAASSDATDVTGYDWSFGDGETGSGETVTHEFGAAGDYLVSVTLTTAGGEERYGATTVSVGGGIPSVSASPRVATPGETVEFAAAGRSTGVTTYSWTFGDGTTATGKAVSHAFEEPGEYTVEVVRAGPGGETSGSVTVTVTDDLNFSYEPIEPDAGEEVRFDAVGEESYAWDFGDGSYAVGASVTHEYDEAGEKTVRMSPSDSLFEGGTPEEVATKTVDVGEPPLQIRSIQRAPQYLIRGADGSYLIRVDVEPFDGAVDRVAVTDGTTTVEATPTLVEVGGSRGTRKFWDAEVDVGSFDLSIGENRLTVTATAADGTVADQSLYLTVVGEGPNLEEAFTGPETRADIMVYEGELVDERLELGTGALLPDGAPISGIKVLQGVAKLQTITTIDMDTLELTVDSDNRLGLRVFGVGLEILGRLDGSSNLDALVADISLDRVQFAAVGSVSTGPRLKIPNPVGKKKIKVSLSIRPALNFEVNEFTRTAFGGPKMVPEEGIYDAYACVRTDNSFEVDKFEISPFIKGTLHGATNVRLTEEYDPSTPDFPNWPFRFEPVGGRVGLDGGIYVTAAGVQSPEITLSSLIDPVTNFGTVREPPDWELFSECRIGPYPSSSSAGGGSTDLAELDDLDAELRSPTGPNPPDDAVRPSTAGTSVARLTDREVLDSRAAVARREDEHQAVWAAHRDGKPAEYGRSIAVATRSSGGWSDRTYLTDADGESHHYPAVAADGDRALAAWVSYDLSEIATFGDLDENADLEVAVDNGGGFGEPTTATGSRRPPEIPPTVAPLSGTGRWVVAWRSSTAASGTDGSQPTVEYVVVNADGSTDSGDSIAAAERPTLTAAETGADLVYYDRDAGAVVRERLTASGRSTVATHDAPALEHLAASRSATAWVPDEDRPDGPRVRYVRDGGVEDVPLPDGQNVLDDLALTETGRGTLLTHRRNAEDGALNGLGYQLDVDGTWRTGRVAATAAETGAESGLTVWKPAVAPAVDGEGFLAVTAAKRNSLEAVDDLFAVSQAFRPTYVVSATPDATGVAPGESVTLSYTIRNAGDRPGTAPVAVEARSNGSTLATSSVAPLAPGETAAGDLTVTLDDSGTVEVVAGDGLAQLVPAAARTTVAVSTPRLSFVDLSVDRAESSATATVTVENRGPIDAGAFDVEVRDGETTIGTTTVDGVPAGGTNSATFSFDPTAIDRSTPETVRLDPDRSLPDGWFEGRDRSTFLGRPRISIADRIDYVAGGGGPTATVLVTNAGPVGTGLEVKAVDPTATAGANGYPDSALYGTASGSVGPAIDGVARTATLSVSLEGVAEGDRVRYVVETDRPTAGAGVPAVEDEVAAVLASGGGESGPVDRADDDDDGDVDDAELRRAIVEWSRGIFTDSELREIVVEWAS